MTDKLSYFIERTDLSIDRLEAKIDKLSSFRWMIIGGSLAVSTISSVLISLAAIYFGVR